MAKDSPLDITGSLQTFNPGSDNSPPADNFLKIFRQLILPIAGIVFAAGMLYFNFQTVSMSVKNHDDRLRANEATISDVRSDQRLFQASLDAVNTSQKKMEAKIESIDDKLDKLREDITMMKGKSRR